MTCNRAFSSLVLLGLVWLASERTAFADDPAPVPAQRMRHVIYLEPVDPNGPEDENGGILQRELLRQAFLLAARASFALATRDGSLRELPPDGLSSENKLRLTASFRPKAEIRLTIESGQGDSRKVLWSGKAGRLKDPPGDLLPLLEEAEALSRSAFVAALKNAGFAPRVSAVTSSPGVPQPVEKLLAEMNFFSQLQAVRALHLAIHKQGESPALIGALARGYVHLGVLSEILWGPAYKVYKARALLYAQRLVHAEPQSPWGLWHRAYVTALTGMHQTGLDDLAGAARLQGTASPAHKAPDWVGLADAVCRFDAQRLQDMAKQESMRERAHLLRFIMLESNAAVHLALKSAAETLQQNPGCFRVHDSIASLGGVSTQHRTTLAGMEAFSEMFPERLKSLPDLPGSVTKQLAEKAAEPRLLATLVDAGKSDADQSGLSWTALGRWAQDTRFQQVCARLTFMRDQWDVPVDDFLPHARAVAAGHPYEKFVESFGFNLSRQSVDVARLFADMPLVDLDPRAGAFCRTLYRVNPQRWEQVNKQVVGNFDSCHDDYEILLAWARGQVKKDRAHTLRKLSPYSPAARAALVREDWDAIKEHALEWEKESQRPDVLLALGQRYVKLHQSDDAERCFKRSLALSPDLPTYRLLAGVYQERGNTEQWLSTLQEVLKQPDTGLNHAQVQVQIARHFMSKKEFKKAQPYADAAADTWAEWAMRCAADCHEELGNWQQAELMVRRVSERYGPVSTYYWFFWCKRTGKGNVAAAQQLLAEQIEQLGPDQSSNDHFVRASYFALTGEPRKAVDALQPIIQEGKTPMAEILAALLLDEAGDSNGRDRVLGQIGSKNRFRPLVDFFVAALARGEKAEVDVAAADKVIKSLSAEDQVTSRYLMGRFLESRGQIKAAQDYYRKRLENETVKQSITAALAGYRLQELGRPGQ